MQPYDRRIWSAPNLLLSHYENIVLCEKYRTTYYVHFDTASSLPHPYLRPYKFNKAAEYSLVLITTN